MEHKMMVSQLVNVAEAAQERYPSGRIFDCIGTGPKPHTSTPPRVDWHHFCCTTRTARGNLKKNMKSKMAKSQNCFLFIQAP